MSAGHAEVRSADDSRERAAPKVITVTLSPAWDLTISTRHLDLGRSHRVEAAVGRLGGKGVNVARVLASIGVGAYAQGPVATEHWPEHDVPASGADRTGTDGATEFGPIWDFTPTPSRLRRSYAVAEESGRATVLNETAAEHPPEVWAALEASITRRLCEPAVSVLVLSGSTPADCPEGFHSRLVNAAHAAGASVIVDTSGPGLLSAARAGTDWVKPNEDELQELFAHEDTTTSAGELARAGARHVLVSGGEDGMVLVDGTGSRSSAHLRRVLQGNPTGAGDASVAGLARCLAAMPQSTPGHAITGHAVTEHTVTEPDATTSVAPAAAKLTDDDVREILTDTVALSASAVLMPQAGQIHPDWQKLKTEVVITGQRPVITRQGP